MGQLKQFLAHLPNRTQPLLHLMVLGKNTVVLKDKKQQCKTYRFPSLRTILLGVSNRQFGQYQHTISSVIHRGHLIWWQSSQ